MEQERSHLDNVNTIGKQTFKRQASTAEKMSAHPRSQVESPSTCLAAVIETQQTVMAAVGEEALLNCQLMQPKDVLQVTWQKILPEGVKNIATYTEYFGVDEESGSVNSDLNVTLITVLVVVSCVCVAATVIIIILLIRKHQNRDSEENRTPRRTTKDTQPKTPLLIQENEVRQQMSPGKNKENGSPKE
ncbi:uncharacterized protein LOC117250360 isoform X4 [Epinephelus lanceolatus]